jgi:hypothetical protein
MFVILILITSELRVLTWINTPLVRLPRDGMKYFDSDRAWLIRPPPFSPLMAPPQQRLSDRTELTVIVLTFRAAVVFGSYGVKSAVLSVRR